MNPDQRARAERLAEKISNLLIKQIEEWFSGFDDDIDRKTNIEIPLVATYAAGLQDESVQGLVKALKRIEIEPCRCDYPIVGNCLPCIAKKALAQWECGE